MTVRDRINKAHETGNDAEILKSVIGLANSLKWAKALPIPYEDLRDVGQDSALAVWESKKKFKPIPGASFASWADRTVRNVLAKHVREKIAELKRVEYEHQRREEIDEDGDVTMPVLEELMSGEDYEKRWERLREEANSKRMSPIVKKALAVNRDKLPSLEAKKAFVEQSLGWSMKEIAATNGSSVSAMKKKMSRWRKMAA